MALTDKLTAIANAIREKTGGTDTLTLDEMATSISSIQTGGATKPYVEETYDSSGNLISANMVGCTNVRLYAFYESNYLSTVNIPDDVKKILNYAFYNCRKLALTKLPSSVTSIGVNAFYKCRNITITNLPESLTEIRSGAFTDCEKITIDSIPAGVEKIETAAFSTCLGLTTITFKGTPLHIHSRTFIGCTNLTTINVPWSEGTDSGAPWGATNATINYDYTGE